ncbi:repressor LexA [Candidatus Desantisbacteria bacterium CG1_02_38_46]|uniref:Repressor LexA n=3 Tax=unclassified Candidatus Desantisiibacteriota TaxID=3106372 RepID=A0A2H9PB45_9BACT|nr:MAG: repressor LexA [Candidatus Desantisbacteria bacterium CG1_02_38_46]PIU51965.1 MAG: repressor LexA [Candidatus Desantisbacteria bacterium CG07_land_8_20_14_0_80_39_15]PIZ15845.1 MAG: repressor LexA [Candidatus Desantisbacteria bacterium CG_4_10_14_0_8_um_filter_39_17]
MAKHLTVRQKEILKRINEYFSEHQIAPTYKELAERMKVNSLATIAKYIKVLVRKGFLQLLPGHRGIIILRSSEDENLLKVPILGTTAGGPPILAQENIKGYETVSTGTFVYIPDFLLEVKGDSMLEAGINNGDLVAVKKGINIQNGDIVVFLVDEESTVKRFYREGGNIILKPANPNYPNIVIRDDGRYLSPIGKVVGVIKKNNT